MGLLFTWLVFSMLAGWIASNKGRSYLEFFLLSALLSPLVGIIAALCAKSAEQVNMQLVKDGYHSNTHRKCPSCAEPILREAVKCRHCGSDCEALPVSKPSRWWQW